MKHVTDLFMSTTSSIRDAMKCIERNQKGIALIVNDEGQLLTTVTDGDIRRALLVGLDLGAFADVLMRHKSSLPYPPPLVAPVGTAQEVLLQMMQERLVRQIPLVDEDGRVVDLVTLDELLPTQDLSLQAVIMAGGLGARLRPLTEDLPKPMLPLGGHPLMEFIVKQLRQVGIQQVCVTTHYKPEKIIEHFGDGRAFGVELSYVNEDNPLGTGGALGLMPKPQEPVLVINGDIVTQVDFRAMLAYHQEHRATMTVAVRRYEVQVPYGVVECEGVNIQRLKEKPKLDFLVNAGIYLLEPQVYEHIPHGQRFDMTDLIQWLLNAGQPVVSFLVREYWLDIGQHVDYVQAQDDFEKGRVASELEG